MNIFEFSASSILETKQDHYVLVHMKGDMRPEVFSVDSLTEEPGLEGSRALVWKLEVSLAKLRIHRRKYSIQVEWERCGRGGLIFKAFDTQKPAVELAIKAKVYYCI